MFLMPTAPEPDATILAIRAGRIAIMKDASLSQSEYERLRDMLDRGEQVHWGMIMDAELMAPPPLRADRALAVQVQRAS